MGCNRDSVPYTLSQGLLDDTSLRIAHYDFLSGLYKLKREIPTSWSPYHIEVHQDNDKETTLVR